MFSEGSVIQIVVNIAMFALMFGMGLTLQGKDFRLIAKSPRPVVVGTALQLLVMPLVGLGLADLFGLPQLLTAGLVVLAALPGGMFSNMYVHIAKGNTALSVTLTALATLVTLFTLPLWLQFAFALESPVGLDGGAPLDVPILETALQLGFLTILPVALGMGMRALRPDSVVWEKRISLPCFILICIGVGLEGAERPEAPIAEFQMSLLPVLAYTACGLILGIAIPALFRIPARNAVTIAVELVVKNTLLGLVLLNKTLPFEAVVPIITFMLFQTPAGIGLLVGWRFLAKKGWVDAVDAPTADVAEAS